MRTGKLSACTKHYATLNCQMTAYQCVSQNRWCDQVSSYSNAPCRIVTRPNSGGRGKILTDQQEQAVVDLVRARNDIRLTEIRQHILDNEDMFNNVGINKFAYYCTHTEKAPGIYKTTIPCAFRKKCRQSEANEDWVCSGKFSFKMAVVKTFPKILHCTVISKSLSKMYF